MLYCHIGLKKLTIDGFDNIVINFHFYMEEIVMHR